MNKHILPITLLTTLVIAGCSSTGDSSFASALNKFTNVLENATPFLQESEEWEKYGIDKSKQGVVYSAASSSDSQYVSRKMDAEYPAAVDRLSRPFASTAKAKQDLDNANKGYHFKYNGIMAVKDKGTSNIIGYCVNYDANRYVNGQPTSWDEPGNVQKQFIYLATNKPISVATSNRDFIKRVCGESFYNQYQ